MRKVMTAEPTKPRKKKLRGRPNRAAASAESLAGVDVANIDPLAVLMQIVADSSAPAMARVAACRLLLRGANTKQKPSADADGLDEISRRAVTLLNRGTTN
jgi:hypothetical protein